MVERTERRTNGSGVPASWGDHFKSEVVANNGSALIVLVEIPTPLDITESAFHLLSCCVACGEPLVYMNIDGTGYDIKWACATENGCGKISTVSNAPIDLEGKTSVFLYIQSGPIRAIEEWIARWLDVHPDRVEVDLRGFL